MRHFVRVAVVAWVCTSPAIADDWSGKLVMLKDEEKQLGKKSPTGLVLDGRKLTSNAVYKIRTDDGTFVELVGQSGWLFKSDAMPLDEAVRYFGARINAEPGKGKWYGRRGTARMNTGRNVSVLTPGGKPSPSLDAALADFDEAVRHDPGGDRWWSERGTCRFLRGEYDRAAEDFTEVVRLKPAAAGGYSSRGIAYRSMKEFDKALADYSKAIELDPKNGVTFNNRALVWEDKKEYDKAIADFTEAVALNPKYSLGFNNRGERHKKARHWEPAAADFKKAIELDPKYAAAFNNLAWLKATCPESKVRDGKAAVEFAKKAVELTPTASARNSLAAAYAEAGEFDKAVEEMQKVLDDKWLSAANRTSYQQRLDVYKGKQPYHEK